MTVLAPHESKMFEAMIQSLDPASGTAKVKFAKVSFRNASIISINKCIHFFFQYGNTDTVLISQLSDFTGKRTERGRYVNNHYHFTKVLTVTFWVVVGQKTSQH